MGHGPINTVGYGVGRASDDPPSNEGNDLTTINGSRQEAIDRMEANLSAMGVDATFDPTDGFLALIDEILNIPPSVGGIELTTALTINGNSSVVKGNSITVTGTLLGSYDDTTVTNVDVVNAPLNNALITLYDTNNNTLGTAYTSNNGSYSITFSPTSTKTVYVAYNGHDFYTPSQSSNKTITVNDANTLTFSQSSYAYQSGASSVTLTLNLSYNGTAVPNGTISVSGSDGSTYSCITNSSGIGTVTIQNPTGDVTYTATYNSLSSSCFMGENITFIIDITGNSFSSGGNYSISSTGDIFVDWGDGTTEIFTPGTRKLSHNYATSGNHRIILTGRITELNSSVFDSSTKNSVVGITLPKTITKLNMMTFGNLSNLANLTFLGNPTLSIDDNCFQRNYALTNVVIPENVRAIGRYCFSSCTALTHVTIPSSVTTIGDGWFSGCTNIVDYQLYWDNPPRTWDNTFMPNNTNTIFTIPYGTTANYVAKSFPSDKLVERSP